MENLKCLFTQFPWDVFLFWLLPLLLLWWWLSQQINRYKKHAEELQDRINFLEGELDACRKTKVTVSSNIEAKDINTGDSTSVDLSGLAAAAVPAPFAAAASKEVKKDDLKVVEGIGPKIEQLCHEIGIYTFAQLADTPASKLKEMLDAAGSRFQIHDPTTWPQQAALARDGKWDELKKWQDELNKGRLS